MKISQLQPEQLSDRQRTELLFNNLDDNYKSGDCIFVPGSSRAVEYRLPKAIQLYKEGRANKILFSGGVIWKGTNLTEAELLANEAMRLGIPKNDILVEKVSRHTKENVLASMLILDRAYDLHHINRLIIVTAAIHMRRMHLVLKTYMPSWITYSLCTVDDRTTQKSNWFNYPFGRERVEREASKLIDYVKRGIIIDEEVEISGD
ncbi:uncharacterized SAM-binding protein YcdF (DUF218 family) [Virgibacillus halotolerans]|uniref:YdcF family protein n=1 Tax=Virgibacillus halotolerans TaxID=1071053 RepID=UPI001961FCAA|nr:YdcF family protein [Virgibacillus halotolerans]MBM7600275.1 uncharacterized SAM-binding protein YcdF (DUF218 family) [Virgibacillus halotolerans]